MLKKLCEKLELFLGKFQEKMLWHLVRYLVTFLMPSFYKRIQGKNVKHVHYKGPVILAMNHPNAFTDPILFTYITYPARVRYLARGDAFKPGITAWLLEQLGIVPIFRIQDGGKEGLKKNDEAYRRVNHLLARNGKIIVFAEGLCIQERRLRPLKKGVARMVFGAYEQLKDDNLVVLPVGVNYSQPDKFRSDLFYNIGEPIHVKDFYAEYQNNPAKANNLFLQALEPKMKDLITHINNKEYDAVVPYLEILVKHTEIEKQGLNRRNLYDHYTVTKQLTATVNNAEINNKEILDEFKAKAKTYFSAVRKAGLRDWLIDPKQNKYVTPFGLFVRCILLSIGLPVYIIGVIGNYLPFKLTETVTKKILKGNKEFYSSISIGVGMVFMLINYSLWFTVVYLFSSTVLPPILVCLSFALAAWFSLYFHFFILKTMGVFTALKNKKTVKAFATQREELLSLINKL